MAGNDTDTSLESFTLWNMESLRAYLSKRGLPVEGNKAELTALCFSARKLNLPIVLSKDEIMKSNHKQYHANLQSFDIRDPLKINNGWMDEKTGMSSWPPIYIGDITSFLMKSLPISECQRHLNDYKIGKAYEYFHCGWLREVFITREKNLWLLRSKCSPSFSPKDDPYNVWVCADPSGEILTAYCSCTAGFGETCNHIAAMLFRVEAANRQGLSACTSLPCTWNIPTKVDLTPVELSTLTIQKSRHGKENGNPQKSMGRNSFTPLKTTLSITTENVFEEMCTALSSVLPNACAFKGREKMKPTAAVPITVKKSTLPTFDSEKFLIKEVLKRQPADSINFTYSKEEVDLINRSTVGQGKNHLWVAVREKRLTSSNFYSVHTKMESLKKGKEVDMVPLISNLLGYKKVNPNLKPLKHGRMMEPVAKNNYIKTMNKSTHSNLKYEECGVFVDSSLPYLAASPDLLISCDCCGQGVVEFKCPLISKCPSCKMFCTCVLPVYLKKCSNGQICLRKCHSYYCQIQGQMAITGRNYCDFVVYTCNGVHKERVHVDPVYYSEVIKNLSTFYCKFVIPEILTPSLNITAVSETEEESTSTTQAGTTYFCPACQNIIKEEDHVKSFKDKSICCDACNLWYHFKCVNITQRKATNLKVWICSSCIDATNQGVLDK